MPVHPLTLTDAADSVSASSLSIAACVTGPRTQTPPGWIVQELKSGQRPLTKRIRSFGQADPEIMAQYNGGSVHMNKYHMMPLRLSHRVV